MASDISDAFKTLGMSAEQAADAFREFAAHLPPITEEDIQLVKLNPSLSWFEKFKIIRSMRKMMEKKEK